MRSCPTCNASCPETATWCTQCYATFSAPSPTAAPAPTPTAAPPPVVPPQPQAPAVNRFGVTAPMTPAAATAGYAPAYPPPGYAPGYPPSGYAPAPMPAPPAAVPRNGMLDRRAVRLVAIAISIGAVGMGLSWLLGKNDRLEPETYIRYAIVLTLGVYAIVGGLLITQLTPAVRLTWFVGKRWFSIATGFAIGGGLGVAMLFVISAAAGHVSSDSRVVTMMSEGDAAHIAIAFLITVVCAPVVEEVLFRGLLLESLRTRGTAAAIWLSGLAFSVWHLNPGALRYYALMGALLGWIYTKRGLAGSMAAHAGFNGVLTIAAAAIVLAPGHVMYGTGVSAYAPSGWHPTKTMYDLALEGPSESLFMVEGLSTPVAPSLDQMSSRLDANTLSSFMPPQYDVSISGTHEVDVPLGRAVEVDLTVQGHRGRMVMIPRQGRSLIVVFFSAGSLKAETDYTKMVDSLTITG